MLNPHKRVFRLIAILWIFVFVNACAPSGFSNPAAAAFSDWKPANVRLLQEVKDSSLPQVIAVYTRQNGFDLEIRCDFLKLSQPANFDLYLALDTRPGGTTLLPIEGGTVDIKWDLLVEAPANSQAQAFDTGFHPITNLRPRVIDDPRLAARVVQINRSNIPGDASRLDLQLFLT